MKLTPKQQRFVAEYLIDLNGTQAAIRAGYSKHTARQTAYETLSKPYIQEAIAEAQAERVNSTKVDAQYVLKRLNQMAELDIKDILRDDMEGFRPLSEWPEAWRKSLSGIDIATIMSHGDDEPIETIIKKVKWPCKIKVVELLGRHIDVKAWEKPEIDLSEGITINMNYGSKK